MGKQNLSMASSIHSTKHKHQENSRAVSSDDSQLQDGFQEIFNFNEHRLQLRGLNVLEGYEEGRRHSDYSLIQYYIRYFDS